MLYLSVVMGALVGFLAHFWCGIAKVNAQATLVITVVVAVLVAVFTYIGRLAHF